MIKDNIFNHFNIMINIMNESKYLKLLHYPLKLENVIDKIDYYPFCSSESTQTAIIHHESLLLYLICTGYPFDDISSKKVINIRSIFKVNSICREGELYIINFNTKVFKQIGKLYHTNHFTENDQPICFRINEKCMKHIYDVAQETLCNISKEILYKHFLLYYTDFLEFDVMSYIMNISIDLLT